MTETKDMLIDGPEELEAMQEADAIRESLKIGVRVWKEVDDKTAKLQDEYDAAYSEFISKHEGLIRSLETSKKAAANAKQTLQEKSVELFKLTGEKTWTAFQCAEGWTLQFDDQIMLDWTLTEAPGNVRRELVTLNTRALDKLFRARIEDGGTIKAFEGCKVPPVMGMRSYTGKVLTDKLEALLTVPVVVEPAKQPDKAEDPIPF